MATKPHCFQSSFSGNHHHWTDRGIKHFQYILRVIWHISKTTFQPTCYFLALLLSQRSSTQPSILPFRTRVFWQIGTNNSMNQKFMNMNKLSRPQTSSQHEKKNYAEKRKCSHRRFKWFEVQWVDWQWSRCTFSFDCEKWTEERREIDTGGSREKVWMPECY